MWGNLITLQGIHNTDDVIAFSVFISRTKCGEILFKKSALSFNEVHIKFIFLPLLHRITVNRRQQKSLKIPILANSFRLHCVLFSTIEILQVLHMTLQKLVANVRERFRESTSKSGTTLTLLTKNIIYSIGKLLTISSRDANFTNQDKPQQEMVCSNIKFYL